MFIARANSEAGEDVTPGIEPQPVSLAGRSLALHRNPVIRLLEGADPADSSNGANDNRRACKLPLIRAPVCKPFRQPTPNNVVDSTHSCLRTAGAMRIRSDMNRTILLLTSLIIATGVNAADKSVNSGINKNFLDPKLKVGAWVERFEREGREVFDHRAKIVERAGIKPGSTVADIGAGTGLFIPELADAVGDQGKVVAVDIVPKFLAHIAGRATETGAKNIDTVSCTAKSTRLKPNSIDLAFICVTYHHFEFPMQTLKSLHRTLRTGGEIYLIDFKRIEDESSDWIMKHVRAGEEVFTREIEFAGFKRIERIKLLKDNYIVRFRKQTG